MDCADKALRLIFGDVTLGVASSGFHLIFSYQTGGLESLCLDGREWLYRTMKPTYWRATTDNDRGNGFPLRSGMWMAADMFQKCVNVEVVRDGIAVTQLRGPKNNIWSAEEAAHEMAISFTYETVTVPVTTTRVTYRVLADGRLRVTAVYTGAEGLPELPCFGMRMVVPTQAVGYAYAGLSGETYPDRMAGAERGIFRVEGLPVTRYLVPQECGMHMNTDWVEITRSSVLDNTVGRPAPFTLRISRADRPIAFSCLPYTAEELENATHHEELPPVRRTVLCIYGAVRGVGGINSWGHDVESAYHIDAEKDHTVSFDLQLADGSAEKP